MIIFLIDLIVASLIKDDVTAMNDEENVCRGVGVQAALIDNFVDMSLPNKNEIAVENEYV